MLSSCAHYKAHPLFGAGYSPYLYDLNELNTYANQNKKNQNKKLDFSDGLNLDEIAVIAVLNNPNLRAFRSQLKVTHAQAFAAGLLPDPQLSLSLDKPTGSAIGLVNATTAGLGFDLMSIISRTASKESAAQQYEKVRLDVLWQEWQTIQKSRATAVRYLLEEQQITLLKNMHERYLNRYKNSNQALQNGDITLDVNGADLTALVDTMSQINQLQQVHNQTLSDLYFLLGLKSDVTLLISDLPNLQQINKKSADIRLEKLARTRPDLMALQAGYESQETNVRLAILAQFPMLNLGLSRAKDTGGVHTSGVNLSLNLPIFNRNRGAIAIQRATREQLKQEYYSRIAQVHTDVNRLLNLQDILLQQQNNLEIYLPKLTSLVEKARIAYSRGDIESLNFLNLESTWTNKRLEQLSIRQSIWENTIALQGMLGMWDALNE